MRIGFRRLKKLWILYLFLLFFSFFMFAISINVYLQSISDSDYRKKNWEAHRNLRERSPKNVVVAHYIGTGNIFGNMSKDDYNKNDFLPIASEGAKGRPVVVPARESLIMQRMFQVNHFNLLASDRIPLNRTLLDYRKPECIKKQYPPDLPTTSVIIVFHNEAWSVLLRTIWSVINRSPNKLLKEILLIDDASERDFLKDDLDKYVKTLPVKIKLMRMPERKGLVPARLLGAREAEGDVLTFLDAHCECSEGWLEPLLARIHENRRSVICPVIDIISDDNFSYTKTFEYHWGGINWHLHFRWFMLTKSELEKEFPDLTKPFSTPAMAGGLFSIDKKYFFEMGSYDEKMKIWGGENVEMSFRIWQCGGVIEISPCSHVGHLFRKSSPYTFPGGITDVLSENLARVALVWMDEWSDFFFLYTPVNSTLRTNLDVRDRRELRERLNCKPFSWYLKNIWPNNFFPSEDRYFGKIISLKEKSKLNTIFEKYVLGIPGLVKARSWLSTLKYVKKYENTLLNSLDFENDSCLRNNLNISSGVLALSTAIVGNCDMDIKLHDMFVITPEGKIMLNEGYCLDFYEESLNTPIVRLAECAETKRQEWSYDLTVQRIQHISSKLCLTLGDKVNTHFKTITVTMKACNDNDDDQRWGLVPFQWRY